MALVFVIFFFLHCDFRMSSWDYFIATAVIYTLCLLYSQCRTYFEHGFNHKASLIAETNDTLRVIIDTKMTWAPGQHMFIRFLTCGVHGFTAHPFTICSVPRGNKQNHLVFYVKQRGGLTGRLMKMAQKSPGVKIPVLLDGPYGGIPNNHLPKFDKNLIIGGGAGAGFTLSMLEDFVHLSGYEDYNAEMKLVVATRDPGMRAWFTQAVEDIAVRHSRSSVIPGLSIHIHETHDEHGSETALDTVLQHPKLDEKTQGTAQERSTTAEIFGIRFFTGRPDLPALTRGFAGQSGASVAVVVCGPASMNHDVSEAAAEAQCNILAGKGGFAREVWLHTESFS
jgi:predicted ferric reductase